MSRKPTVEGGKRDEIIEAALEVFFEKGYDGTSIRMIMRKVDSEVGLFYYYFKNKDDVYEKVLERFLAKYKADMEVIVKNAYRDPYRAISCFFSYLQKEAKTFREKYVDKINKTIRLAIRESLLTMMVPYIKQIIEILMQFGARPRLDLDVAAMFLAHGAGSIIIHEDDEFLQRAIGEMRKGVNLIMGLDLAQADLMFPLEPSKEDADNIAEFVQAADETIFAENHLETIGQIEKRIAQKEIFVICYEKKMVGLVLFSRERQEVDYLFVAKEFRHKGVATRLFVTTMAQYPLQSKLSVVLASKKDFAENESESERFLRRFGFQKEDSLENAESKKERRSMIIPEKRPERKQVG